MKRLALLALPLILAQCSSDIAPSAQQLKPLKPYEDFGKASGEATQGDIAKFLAGRPVDNGADLASYQRNTPAYHKHAKNFDFIWRRAGSLRSLRQSQYFHSTIKPVIGSPSTVVYPFGGPDIMYAASIFPTASTYVLIGLEKVGSVPSVPYGSTTSLLSGLTSVMNEPIRYGYYITAEMKNAPSITPIMMASIALMRGEISSVSAIDAAGRPGVQIDFKLPYGGHKKVIYVSADLSNSGFNSSFSQWLANYSGGTGYFKAASYLAHGGSFSEIRNWMLSNCQSILQDDSGIPHRYYDQEQWDATLLGTYSRPIPLFSQWKQGDLEAAYSAAGTLEEIPFGSGYHMKTREANLQIYKRK